MNSRSRLGSTGYQFFMLVLCLYALAVLAAQAAIRLNPEIEAVLDYADYAVCALFFGDFVLSLWKAEDPKRYFFTWGWLDLLSSVPMLDVGRWGRLARVLRVFRVLRGLRATRLLAAAVLRERAENTFLAASLLALLLIVFCSIATLHFEAVPEGNIKTAEDAIWWSLTTITTVGYGDHYPVTAEGRLVAAVLMCAGVGLFGTMSAFLAAWFVGSGQSAGEAEIAALRAEVRALRKALENERAGEPADAPGPSESVV